MADHSVQEADVEEERPSRLQEMRQRFALRQQRKADVKGAAEKLVEIKEAEAAAQEERRNWFIDAGVGVARAIPGAAEEFFDLVSSLDDSVMSAFGETFGNVAFNWDTGFRYDSPEEYAKNPTRSLLRIPEDGWRQIKEIIPETETGVGALVEVGVKFAAGFIGGKMLLKGAGMVQSFSRTSQLSNAALSGAFADGVVFDGHDQRLSDFLITLDNPVFNNYVTQYLASDFEHTELEGRMRGILEGGALGLMADSILIGIRGMWRYRQAKRVTKALKEADDAEIVLKEVQPKKVEAETSTPAKVADEVDLDPEVKIQREAEAKVDSIRTTVRITEEQARAFRTAITDGDEKAASDILQDFNQENIDFAGMESGADIKRVMLETERVFAEIIDEVKGGVQTNKRTRMLANLVGESAENVSKLFHDVSTDNGIAARFYSAQRVMFASSAEQIRLARIALDTKAPADEAAAMHQMQVHVALQADLKGAQTEMARAVQSMGMLKEQKVENWREFDLLKRRFGKKTGNSKAFEKHLESMLERGLTLANFNAKLRTTGWERARNIFVEFVINFMLSAPKTHVVNFNSNVLQTFLYSIDRTTAGAFRSVALGDRAAWREAKLDVFHKFASLDGAYRLAIKAWKTGAPVVDKRQRIEFLTRQSIAVEGTGRNLQPSDAGKSAFGQKIINRKTEIVLDDDGAPMSAVDFNWWQRSINSIGRIVRVPGRALITGDEFFKAVNRSAEIQVLSYRRADEEALKKGLEYATDAYEKFVTKRVIELVDPKGASQAHREIRLASIEKARLVTFQESPITEIGAGMEKMMNSNVFFKLMIAPFFRTPMNILRQGLLDRTPLGLVLKQHRETIRKRGRDGSEAIARMTSGMAVMSAFYAYLSSSEDEPGRLEIVGKIPWDSSRKHAGVRDYSVRIPWTNHWWQYNRLEPLGMWIGMVVDMKTHADYQTPGVDDDKTFAFGQAALGAFIKNVSDKTWAKSLTDIVEMTASVSDSNPGSSQRAMSKFISGELGKLIPQIVKSAGKEIDAIVVGEDPTAREAWTVLDGLSAQLPILNRSLPDRHDPLGRVIGREAGPLAVINPFSTSKTITNELDKELFRLSFTMRPMAKSLAAGSVQLTGKEYSTLTGLLSKTGLVEILTTFVTSEGWHSLTDPMKVSLLKRQISIARKTAIELFTATPEIRKRLTTAQLNAILLMVGIE